MQKFLSLLFFFIAVVICSGQQPETDRITLERSGAYIKIPISDVKLAEQPLAEIPFIKALQKLSLGKVESYLPSEKDKKIISTCMHPFVAALHYSFAQHRPLSISPDMVWLMILQGFANHVNVNADSLRKKFVDFDSTKMLHIVRDDFRKGRVKNAWDEVITGFSDSIAKYTDESLNSLILNKFSTTGQKETISFQLALMDAMKKYFRFGCSTACGIPYIILEGEPEDWMSIKEQLPKFREYGLDFWIDNLQPVVDELYESSVGNVDTLFWKSIYKWDSGSGGPAVTGWIIRFFPYIMLDSQLKINKYLEHDYFENKIYYEPYGMHADNFPTALSSCDFKWYYYLVKNPPAIYDMIFCAGFIGIYQDSNLVLRPEINWFVAEKADINNINFEENAAVYNSTEDREVEAVRIRQKNKFYPLRYENCEAPDERAIFDIENNRTFEEGREALLKYIDSKKHIYINKKGAIVKGKAKVEFIISPEGDVYTLDIFTEHKELRAPANRIFYGMPKWQPAQKDGEYAMVKMEIEIDFNEK